MVLPPAVIECALPDADWQAYSIGVMGMRPEKDSIPLRNEDSAQKCAVSS
ncbi:MAG: hypothetical protein QHH06_13680 [Clostridiales bacterium]|jgi:hypothetical protein|nr:hypothetical protein [Eubacteriales bacterium]MDH7567492.1 hypothetical protein [Clostridiales bacterium]